MNQNRRSASMGGSNQIWDGFLPKNSILMARSQVDVPISQEKGDQISQSKLVFLWTGQRNGLSSCLNSNQEPPSEAAQLLEKMVQAMGLKMAEVFVTSTEQSIPASCKVLVVLGEASLQSQTAVQVLKTHSPETLLKNPALKKEAWTTLLKAAEILGLSIPKRGEKS